MTDFDIYARRAESKKFITATVSARMCVHCLKAICYTHAHISFMCRFNKLRRLRGKAVDRALDDVIANLSIKDDPSRLLTLPQFTLDRIYTHLSSRDALCLSATCKQVYPHRLSAYIALHFHFRPEQYGLASLITTLSSPAAPR